MQQILKEPANYAREWAALFGTSRIDEQDTLVDGRLEDKANPWGKMFQEAAWRIMSHSEREWMMKQAACKISALWEDTDLMESFVDLDMNLLRAAVCARQIPPPGMVDIVHSEESGGDSTAGENSHVCPHDERLVRMP